MAYGSSIFFVPDPSNDSNLMVDRPVHGLDKIIGFSNKHNMFIRSKVGTFKPKYLNATLIFTKPQNFKKAISILKWKDAMTKEFDALLANRNWALVPLSIGKKVIKYKWVFWVSIKVDTTIDKCKARSVANEYLQVTSLDFLETFSSITKPTTIKVVFTLALSRDWPIRQVDINNAFLNGDLLKDMYMEQIFGFAQGSGLVCKLKKSLYGIK